MKYFRLLIQLLWIAIGLVACGPVGDANYFAHVWEDVNGDGVEELDEKPLPDIVIQIINPNNGILWYRDITDQDGNMYAFNAGGKCGQYTIYLSVPEGYWATTPVITQSSCEANFGLQPYHP